MGHVENVANIFLKVSMFLNSHFCLRQFLVQRIVLSVILQQSHPYLSLAKEIWMKENDCRITKCKLCYICTTYSSFWIMLDTFLIKRKKIWKVVFMIHFRTLSSRRHKVGISICKGIQDKVKIESLCDVGRKMTSGNN